MKCGADPGAGIRLCRAQWVQFRLGPATGVWQYPAPRAAFSYRLDHALTAVRMAPGFARWIQLYWPPIKCTLSLVWWGGLCGGPGIPTGEGGAHKLASCRCTTRGRRALPHSGQELRRGHAQCPQTPHDQTPGVKFRSGPIVLGHQHSGIPTDIYLASSIIIMGQLWLLNTYASWV